MALSDAIQNLAYGQFKLPYQQTNIWMNLFQDYSMEFPGFGNSLVIPTDKGATREEIEKAAGDGNYVPTDRSATYTVDANVANSKWGDPTLTDIETTMLTIDQFRTINKMVNFLAQRRIRPNILASAVMQSVREMQRAVNAHARATMLAAPAVSQRTHIAVTAANITTPNDAFKTAVIDQ